MKISQDCDHLKLSFELFPAKDPVQERRFWRTVGCLETLNPLFFSMTYGALGSMRDAGKSMIDKLCAESSTPVAAHLTCAGRSCTELKAEIDSFLSAGVRHIVALRGDSVGQNEFSQEHCRYASDLVSLVNSYAGLDCSVAAYPETHPEASSAAEDLNNLKVKLDLGAQRAITQFFFEPDTYLRFRDRAWQAGIRQPIVPGILPVHDIERVISFSARCGANVPAGVIDDFRVWSHDPAASRELAIAHCYALCETLKQEGVQHLHFYTLNQSDLSFEVSRKLAPKPVIADTAAA